MHLTLERTEAAWKTCAAEVDFSSRLPMYKPKILRAHLKAAIADLTQNPDKLLVFADEGNTVATGTGSLSFEYRYKLNIIITDYIGDADAIMVALLVWVEVHQRDLLDNADFRKTGIGFDVDFNNHQTIDLSIKLTGLAPTRPAPDSHAQDCPGLAAQPGTGDRQPAGAVRHTLRCKQAAQEATRQERKNQTAESRDV
jgi:hypothetical protein